MVDLTNVRLSDAVALGAELRARASNASSMEGASRRIVDHLYEQLRRGEGHTCALVRLFKTHPTADLAPELMAAARHFRGEKPATPSRASLVLMATRGDDPAWNDRHRSKAHQAIVVPDDGFGAGLPMIAELFRQFGIPLSAVVEEDEAAVREFDRLGCPSFLVEDAEHSPFIPAKDFVRQHGVRSVLSFGSLLPRAGMFFVLLFSKVPVTRSTADMLKPLALNVKIALLPFCDAEMFEK